MMRMTTPAVRPGQVTLISHDVFVGEMEWGKFPKG